LAHNAPAAATYQPTHRILRSSSGVRGVLSCADVFEARRSVYACSAHRQFHHPIIAGVDDKKVAGGIHRHAEGELEAGERQHLLSG
jgi:hypothetical protein